MKLAPVEILAAIVEYIIEKLSVKSSSHSLLNSLLTYFKERLESDTY